MLRPRTEAHRGRRTGRCSTGQRVPYRLRKDTPATSRVLNPQVERMSVDDGTCLRSRHRDGSGRSQAGTDQRGDERGGQSGRDAPNGGPSAGGPICRVSASAEHA